MRYDRHGGGHRGESRSYCSRTEVKFSEITSGVQRHKSLRQTGRDTLGGWHEDALEVISKLGRQLARVVGRDEGETVQHLRQRLGVVLLRDNVGLLGSRAPEAAPAQVMGLL